MSSVHVKLYVRDVCYGNAFSCIMVYSFRFIHLVIASAFVLESVCVSIWVFSLSGRFVC